MLLMKIIAQSTRYSKNYKYIITGFCNNVRKKTLNKLSYISGLMVTFNLRNQVVLKLVTIG